AESIRGQKRRGAATEVERFEGRVIPLTLEATKLQLIGNGRDVAIGGDALADGDRKITVAAPTRAKRDVHVDVTQLRSPPLPEYRLDTTEDLSRLLLHQAANFEGRQDGQGVRGAGLKADCQLVDVLVAERQQVQHAPLQLRDSSRE